MLLLRHLVYLLGKETTNPKAIDLSTDPNKRHNSYVIFQKAFTDEKTSIEHQVTQV